jgi:hypothetical protein
MRMVEGFAFPSSQMPASKAQQERRDLKETFRKGLLKEMTTHCHEQTGERRQLKRSKWDWKRLRWIIVCTCILLLLTVLPNLLQIGSQRTQGQTNIHEMGKYGGRGGILPASDNQPTQKGSPEPTRSPVSETGQYCNTLVPVLHHFGFAAEDAGNGLVRFTLPDFDRVPPNMPGIDPTPYLVKLPPPDSAKDLTYERGTRRVCASETNGKEALRQFILGVLQDEGQKKAPQISIDPAKWVTDAILGFWDNLWRQTVDFFQHQIIDWVNSLGFIWMTPAALSYKNPMVLSGASWALAALDGYIALLLVIGGSQVLLNRSLGLEERSSVLAVAMRVILTALVANTGFFLFLPEMVELSNSLGMGIMAALLKAAPGDVSLPLGAINWVEQPISWGIFILVYFFTSLLLIAVEAVRLAVLDVTIMLSPLWIMALANEYSRAWGRFGALTFFSALLMQPIQVACVSLGSALIANFGHLNPNDPAICEHMPASAHDACVAHLGHASLSSSMNIIVLVLGIATLYVAIKIPGMLFSNALRASVGSVNRDIGQVARAAMSFVFVQKQLSK